MDQIIDNKEVEATQPVNDGTKVYENSSLVMLCGKCNSRYTLEENIPSNKGIQIYLPPTNKSEFTLVCKECGNRMGLFYVETAKKNDEVISENQELITETEQSGDINNEATA